MKAVFDHHQRVHDPKHFLARGMPRPSPEQPARIDALHLGAMDAACAFMPAVDHGAKPIAAVHSPAYLTFLETIHERWRQMPDASDEVIPNVHPDRRSGAYPQSPVGQAGFHQADTACPIAAGTWESAYWSAQTALTATDLVVDGEPAAYALCRPPGHHAFADQAGGFCFLNNSAIVAHHLVSQGRRPAILDIDVHHGNGTQGIFYRRRDVLTVSLHADPAWFYPFFWGYAHERGEGEGLGYNVNLPLPLGTSDGGFLTALAIALEPIRAFSADFLVVALGLDTSASDPFKGMAITTPGFAQIGKAIAAVSLPSVIVQEGGYLSDDLGANLTSFLSGFESV